MTALAETLATLLAEARTAFDEVVIVEGDIRRDYNRLLAGGWKLGKILATLKENVGHSRWLIWLGGNLPTLAGHDGRKAADCMAFYRDNAALSNPTNLSDFSTDSVRRYLHGYLPAKIHRQLEGDEKLPQVASFDSVTNRFTLLHRRITENHATPPPLESVGPQVRLIVDGLREIYGREIIDGLLA